MTRPARATTRPSLTTARRNIEMAYNKAVKKS